MGKIDYFRQTEGRLYAYPVLQERIKGLKQDIEDLYKEQFEVSKSIVLRGVTGGLPADKDIILDEKRNKVKKELEAIIKRDEKEIKKLEKALLYIKKDVYYDIIPTLYFQKHEFGKEEAVLVAIEKISKKFFSENEKSEEISRATIFRNKRRLVTTISVFLYGTQGFEGC